MTPMPPVDELRRLREEHPDATLAQLSALCGVSPERLGRAVQVDPIKLTLKALERFILKHDKSLSNLFQFCFKIYLAPPHLGRQMRRLNIVRLRVSNEVVHAGVVKFRTGAFSSFGLTLTQGGAANNSFLA